MDYTSVLNVLEFLHSSNHWIQTNKELDQHEQSLFKLYRNRIVYLLNSSDSPDFLLIKRTEEQTALFLQYRRIHQFLPGYFLAFTEDKHTFNSIGLISCLVSDFTLSQTSFHITTLKESIDLAIARLVSSKLFQWCS